MRALPSSENPSVSPGLGGGAALAAPEADMAATLTQWAAARRERSASELLRELRATFPDSPLAVRVRALAALQRR